MDRNIVLAPCKDLVRPISIQKAQPFHTSSDWALSAHGGSCKGSIQTFTKYVLTMKGSPYPNGEETSMSSVSQYLLIDLELELRDSEDAFESSYEEPQQYVRYKLRKIQLTVGYRWWAL
jgi:hypothetical protein